MADLLGTDEFLVNRNDVTYTQQQETLMASLQDTDHLLINRAGQTYKITGEDLINSVIDPLEVTVILAPTEGYTDTEVTAVPVISGGKQPDGGFVFTYQWVTADDGAGTNKANIAGANNATFTPDNAQVGLFLGCVVGTIDALGTSAEGEAYIGPIQVLAQAPVIADIAISEIYDGQNRFTDKEFPYVTTMAVDGEPDPTYEVKAKLSGTTFDFDVLSDVITDVEGGGIKTCETDLIQSVEDDTPTTAEARFIPRTTFTNQPIQDANWSTMTVRSSGDLTLNTDFNENGDVFAVYNPVPFFATGGRVSRPGFDVPMALAASDDGVTWTVVDSGQSPVYTDKATQLKSPEAYKYFATYRIDINSPEIVSVDMDAPYSFGSPATSITLTFPTSNGFDCFEPDDVVQGVDANQDVIWSQQASSEANLQPNSKAFDGNVDTFNQVAFSDSDSNIVFTLTPVPSGEAVEIKTQQEKVAGTIECNGVSITDNTNTPVITQCGHTTSSTLTIKQNINSGQASQDVNKIFYVKVGDQLLVDQGVAVDNVKVISKDEDANTITVDGGEWRVTDDVIYSNDLVSETGSYHNGRRPDRAFDGDLTTTSASENNGEYLEWTPTGGFDWTTSVELYVYQQEGSTQYNNDAAVAIPTLSGSEGWVTVKTGGGTINQVVLTGSPGDKAVVSAFRIDGVILFDPSGETKLVKETPYAAKLTVASSENLELLTGDVFMTDGSETPATQTPYKLVTTDIESVSTNSYSVAGGGNARANIGNMFDGDTSTNGECDIGTTNILFDEPIPGVTKIEYYTSWNNNRVDASPANNHKLGYNANVNNDAIFYQNGSPTGWYTAYEGAPIDFTGVYFEVVNNGLNSQNCYAIKVNGTVLDLNNRVVLTFPGDVSQNPDLRYFLPGDVVQSEKPWNQDKEWAAHLTSSPGWAGSAYEAEKAFDGDSSTHAGSASGGTLTFNPYYEVPANSVIEGWFGSSDTQLMDVTVNGVLNREVPGGDWRVVNYDNSTEFKVMTITRSAGVDNSADLRRLRINGKELVDNIIVDDTAVKVISTGYPDSNTMVVDGGEWDTSNQSEVWSEGGSGDVFTSAYKWEYMFDGNTSTPYCPLGVGTWTPSTPLPINKSLRLWAGNAVESLTNATIKVNGIEVVSDSPNAWVDVPSVTELINIQLTTVSSSDPAIVYAVEVDGKILVDAGISDLGDTHVEYQTNGGQGSIIEVNTDDSTLLVTNSGDGDNRWIAENKAGTDFYVAPANAVPITQDFAYGKLQIVNNKAQVTGIQKDDPGFLPVPAKDYSIKFPAVFPTGNEPDIDIPRGACVAAIVAAENSEGRSVKESNCFMPLEVNPEGAAGPITDSTPTQLTVATNANLGEFSPGDNLVMVTEDNVISNYTMQTSAIESVETVSADTHYDQQMTPSASTNVIADPSTITGWIDTTLNSTNLTGDASVIFARFDNPTIAVFSKITAGCGASGTHYLVYWDDNTSEWVVDTKYVGALCQGSLNDSVVGKSSATTWALFRPNPDPNLADGERFNATRSFNFSSGTDLTTPNWGFVYSSQFTPTTLTFLGDVSTNPDLKFFRPGDVVQGAELGQKYNLYGTDLNETTLVDPSSISGWSENSLGSSNLTGNANILYADFGGSISPVFTRIDGGTGSDYTHQNLCYWNGTDWIVNATVSGGLSASNQLIATKSARYWAAFRNDSSLAIGSTVSSFSKANAGSHWSADVFGFSAPDDGAVKVISTGYPNSNTMVVDGGEWSDGTSDPGTDQSRIWSNGGSGVFNQPVQNMFDGQTGDGSTFASFNDALVTFDPPVPFTELQVNGYLNSGMGANPTCLINGIDVTSQISQQNPGESTDNGHANIITGVGSALSSFKCTTANNYGNPISAIVIDGLILKDPAGDTKATYGPVTGTGTFQSADLAANTITMSVSNDRWIDNTNRLGIDFYCRDNITVLNADNPKHVAMQQAIAAAFDAFPEKVNERRTSIASSFYRLMEGETLSAADYTLLEETVLDAVNAQEPFALNGFYPLYYTSAKADSASSTDSHHSHTIAGVTYYMPDGGTLYHGNYIAPETATTDTNDSSSSSHNHGSGSSY